MSDELEHDDLEADDELEHDDLDDEVGAPGNRVEGGRAQAVVEHVARHLVDDPDGVFVDATEQRGTANLLIHTSPGDMGRIIGKRGRVIQAIRQVGRAAAATEGRRVNIDVAD